jgi:hypothetical protein
MDNAVAEKIPEIYSYILQEETAYKTTRVPLATNWRDWNMKEHVDRSFTLLNSRFYQGAQDYRRPFNNIILPIRNVNVRSEGFDVKDAEIYVDNPDHYHKSAIARKFHNWWAKENKIDTAIDESVESYFDYGLTLAKNVNEVRPEIIQLQQVAFCDQTDVMSGPICLKHHLSVSELLDMKGKWYSNEVDRVVRMAKLSKCIDPADEATVETPGKYVAVYELEGMFPESWLGQEKLGEDWQDTGKYTLQTHIVTYYLSPLDNTTKMGVCLFKGKRSKTIFKALKRDPIHGRACGRGGIEELFHAQIWTNYSELQVSQVLEAVSKVVLKTNKKKIAASNNFANIKQGTILDLDGDGTLEQVMIQPINKTAFDNFTNKWEQVARTIGSASDPQLGLNPVSGTPLGTTEIVTSQGVGIHEYRQGQIAAFWQEIYRDWVIPHLATAINKDHKWLEDLSLDELQDFAERIISNESNKVIKKTILAGNLITKEDVDAMKGQMKEMFMAGGNKRFMEIVKGDFESLPLDLEISIAGKQKNLAENVSKLNALFRILFTPGAIQAIRQDGELSSLLNQILEGSGFSPMKYGIRQQPTPSPMVQLPQQGMQAQPTSNPSMMV